MERRTRIVRGIAIALVAVAALLMISLGRKEWDSGPAHEDVFVGDGIPGTLYLPAELDDGQLPYQLPVGQRPPVLVLAHGYSADRRVMSTMARSIAEAGYAVVTFDFRGHGDNTHPFQGDLRDDFKAVVDWVQTSPLVDGTRIAVAGHSMGAGAVLAFGSVDPRPTAVIPISGGNEVSDAVLPKHLLLIAAENDPSRIRDRQADVYADLKDKTDVTLTEVSGKDHITILFSNTAITDIVTFLDKSFGIARPASDDIGLHDDRLGTALLYFLVVLALIGFLGLAAGAFVDPEPTDATPWGLAVIAGALLVTMPIFATGGPQFLPLGAGQPVVLHTLLAAALIWLVRAGAQRGLVGDRWTAAVGTSEWLPMRAVVAPGLAAAGAMVLLLLPLAGITHRLVPTWERAVLWVVVAALALPFFAAFEGIVRRGTARQAIVWGALGRLVLVAVLVIGLAVQVLPQVLGLVIPLLVLQYVVLEIFAATCYAKGRNPAVIAVVDAVFISWIVVTLTPLG